MKTRKPPCFQFFFAPKAGDSGNGTLHNVFQLVMQIDFYNFLLENFSQFKKSTNGMFPKGAFIGLEGFLKGKHPTIPHFHKIPSQKDVYFNLVIPKPSKRAKEHLYHYLWDEVVFLGHLFEYLKMSVRDYAQIEGGYIAEEQPVFPTLTGVHGYLSMQLSVLYSEEINKLFLKGERKDKLQTLVEKAINSIIAPIDRDDYNPSEQTRANLYNEYIQVSVFGNGCGMFIEQAEKNKGWKILGKNFDFPVQVAGCLAGICTIFLETQIK